MSWWGLTREDTNPKKLLKNQGCGGAHAPLARVPHPFKEWSFSLCFLTGSENPLGAPHHFPVSLPEAPLLISLLRLWKCLVFTEPSHSEGVTILWCSATPRGGARRVPVPGGFPRTQGVVMSPILTTSWSISLILHCSHPSRKTDWSGALSPSFDNLRNIGHCCGTYTI